MPSPAANRRAVSAATIQRRLLLVNQLSKQLRLRDAAEPFVPDRVQFLARLADEASACTALLYFVCQLKGTRSKFRGAIVRQRLLAGEDAPLLRDALEMPSLCTP